LRGRQHSSTALVIAKSTLLTAADPQLAALVPAGAAEVSEWFLKDHARDYPYLRHAWYGASASALQNWVLPGIQLHYAARKQVLEAQVRRAINEGAEQVVVVAGGFDTLAYRLHRELEAVRFFELDHPATQQSKRQSLLDHGSVEGNLTLHPVDLTQTALSDALAQAGVERGRSAMIVVEGLLMYLDTEQVEALVASLDVFFTAGAVVALTFMVPDAKGRRRFHNASWLLDVWLRLEGEPFLSAFGHEQLVALLGRHHFGNAAFWDHERLRKEVLPPALRRRPLSIGEHICVTRRT
jgi:methyltransferase (TIGR00027 family)